MVFFPKPLSLRDSPRPGGVDYLCPGASRPGGGCPGAEAQLGSLGRSGELDVGSAGCSATRRWLHRWDRPGGVPSSSGPPDCSGSPRAPGIARSRPLGSSALSPEVSSATRRWLGISKAPERSTLWSCEVAQAGASGKEIGLGAGAGPGPGRRWSPRGRRVSLTVPVWEAVTIADFSQSFLRKIRGG